MAATVLTARFVDGVKPTAGRQVDYPDAQVPGLVLRVSPGGRKAWALRYRNAVGRQCRLTLGPVAKAGVTGGRDDPEGRALDLAEARRRASVKLGAVADGADPQAAKRKAKREAQAQPIKTLDDLMTAYFDACERGLWRPKGKVKRARVLKDERGIYARHIKAELGGERLEDVDRQAIRNLLRRMMGKGIGAQVVRVHAVIRQAMAWAVDQERLLYSPAAFAPMIVVKPKTRTLTDAQLKAFWAGLKDPAALRTADGQPVYLGRPMAIALQLLTLLLVRRNEIAGARVDELDLDQAVWVIGADRMKGGRPHTVPLPPKSVELFREALALRGGQSEYVFPGMKGLDRPIHEASVTHGMAAITGALGIDGSSHDLRRTGSSALTSERIGISPFIRSQVLGHSSDAGGGAAVTRAHYDTNLYLTEKRAALAAWESLLLEIVGERVRPSNVRAIRERNGQ